MIILRLKKIDWWLLAAIFLLAAFSLTFLFGYSQRFFWRQLVWYVLALIIIFVGINFNWRLIINQKGFLLVLYWLSIIFLIISNLQNKLVRGTTSWLSIGNLQFEPAEIVKMTLILILASFFSRRHLEAWQGKNILISSLYAWLPAILVAFQPDLGSAVVLIGIWAGFLLMSKISKKRLLWGVIFILVLLILSWIFFLKPYQQDRIIGFLFPANDPLGINYNAIQAKIAIGSAGFLGKGFMAGTQSQFHFLPEAQADFIFAALVEEWGIFGGCLIILTFIVIIARLIQIGLKAKSNSWKFISLGTVLALAIQFFLNLGSNLALLPVTGITFPFLSYGGSSLLTNAFLISIIQYINLESSI